MPLADCPSCGKSVSRDARNCPACGHPISRGKLPVINPSVSSFLEKRPNLTLLGLAWALYWRLHIFAFIIGAFIGILLNAFADF